MKDTEGTPKRVAFLVEDKIERDLLSLALTRASIAVDIFSSISDAESFLEKNIPDLLIIDTSLPGENPIKFLQQLKTKTRTAYIPVIAISSFRFSEVIEKFRRSGVKELLVKPVDVDLFLERVGKMLNKV